VRGRKKSYQREGKGDVLLRSFLYFNRFANLYVLFSFFFCAWKDVEEADGDLASVFGDHVAIRADCSQDLQIRRYMRTSLFGVSKLSFSSTPFTGTKRKKGWKKERKKVKNERERVCSYCYTRTCSTRCEKTFFFSDYSS